MGFMNFLIVSVAIVLLVQASNVKRDDNNDKAESTSEAEPQKDLCLGRTPCGWAVYNRTNRIIDYFMKNRCICPEGRKCLRDEDDITIAAYVYRCKVNEPATSTEADENS